MVCQVIFKKLTKFSSHGIILSLSASSARREVETMNYIAAFVISVAANVVSNCISKWLDRFNKHDN